MVFVLSAQLTLFIALITFLSPRKLFNYYYYYYYYYYFNNEGTCWVVSIHANTHPVKIRHLSKYPNVFGPFSSRIIQGMAQVGKTKTYIA